VGRVHVPAGKFLTGPIHLASKIELHVAKGATLLFATDSARYLPAVLTRFEGVELYGYSQFLLLASRARDPRTGLMYHAWDSKHAQPWADSPTGTLPNYWGRAVGWYLMAAMDVLDDLPASHPDRGALLDVVRELAASVARVQDPVSGLWYQVLDQPGRTGNYREASASSMFVYAFAKGARNGWLETRYRALASRGFTGIRCARPSLSGVCQVAGLGGTARRDGTFAYYVSEPVVADDYKGVGPLIMAALELGR